MDLDSVRKRTARVARFRAQRFTNNRAGLQWPTILFFPDRERTAKNIQPKGVADKLLAHPNEEPGHADQFKERIV